MSHIFPQELPTKLVMHNVAVEFSTLPNGAMFIPVHIQENSELTYGVVRVKTGAKTYSTPFDSFREATGREKVKKHTLLRPENYKVYPCYFSTVVVNTEEYSSYID